MRGFFHNKRKGAGGFSLVEMAVVIIISGILLVPFYTYLISLTKARPDEDRLRIMQYGIGEYLRVHGQYPCPAGLALPESDPAYANGDTVAHACNSGNLFKMKSPTTGADDIYIGAVPVDQLARAMDCEPDPDVGSIPAEMQSVLKSKLHWMKEVFLKGSDALAGPNQSFDKMRCPNRSDMLDKWGDKYIYAVSVKATDISTYDPSKGSVRIIDTAGHDLKSGQASDQDQIYAIFGMGEDRAGGIRADGSAFGTPCPAGLAETTNCSLTAGAVLKVASGAPSLKQDANYFDDEVTYSIAGAMSEEDYWSWKNTNANPTVRDIGFNPKSRVIIDTPGVDGLGNKKVGTTTDMLIVNGGHGTCDGMGADGLCVTGGSLVSDKDINATGGGVHAIAASPPPPPNTTCAAGDKGCIDAGGSFVSPKFCYKPAMSSNCP